MVSMNRLSIEKRTRILAALVEGNSIRATVRMTGHSKNTIAKLLVDIGRACEAYQDAVLTDLNSTDVQCDEIRSFVGVKNKNVPEDKQDEFGYGDVWTFTAIDSDTKLVPTWLVGERTAESARLFIQDLQTRLRGRVQLTTDGFKPYVSAVGDAFGDNVDYAVLVKHYGVPPERDSRYSPAVCTGTDKRTVRGCPDPTKINTSYVERQNLTMRMHMRRFTWLTDAFSRKVENHTAAVALHFMNYNFCRRHKTLGTTPAVAAGVADHEWTIREIAELVEVEPVS